MKKGSDLRSKTSIMLSKAIARIEALEARAYLTGVVLGTPQDTVPSGITTSFATLNTSTGANADFNGDGKTDLVLTDQASNKVALLLGNGDGTFGAPATAVVGGSPLPATVADMNADGHLDIISGGLGNITIVSGNGTGGFLGSANIISTVVQNNHAIAVADFNGDGRNDIVSVSTDVGASPAGEILLQQSDGSFSVQQTLNIGHTGLAAIAVADFNGDGHPDLAIADQVDNKVTILLNNGNGTFAAPVDLAAGGSPTSIVAADFNGDGHPDIVTSNSTGGTVSYFGGNGNGTFKAKVDSAVVGRPAGGGPLKVRFTQFNSDSFPDLLVLLNTNQQKIDAAVLLGNGDGTFHTGTTIVTNGAQRTSLAAGDLNGDGLTDALVADSAKVTTLLNITAQDTTPPTASITPAAPAPTAGSTTYQFFVTYADNTQVDASTLNNNNLTVTGPNGFSQSPTLVSQNLGNGPTVQATYQLTFPAPLSAADNGNYTVTSTSNGSNAVKDANGNALAAATIGTIQFNVGAPSSGAVTVGPLVFQVLPSVVAGSKGKPVKIKVTNSSGAAFKGAYVVTLAASPSGPTIASDSIILKQITKKANLKAGKSANVTINGWNYPTQVGNYFIVVQADNGQGGIGTNATATQVNVAAPFVDLNNLWNGIAPALVAGKKTSLAFKVLNRGNVAAHGVLGVNLDAISTADQSVQAVASVPLHINIKPGKTATIHLRFAAAVIPSGTYNLRMTLASVSGLTNFTAEAPMVSSNTFTV